jgi:hypothetical protein
MNIEMNVRNVYSAWLLLRKQFGIQLSDQENHEKAINKIGFWLEFKSGASGWKVGCSMRSYEL